MEDESIPYDRRFFPTWDRIVVDDRACNIRDYILIRDGINVHVNEDCRPIQGEWTSPYDLRTFSASYLLDIDHLVPLKEAWISGANTWSDDERESFANDINNPELIAVSRHSNEAKDPAKWLPTNQAFQCDYVLAWIQVKQFYSLTIDALEKKALEDVLENC